MKFKHLFFSAVLAVAVMSLVPVATAQPAKPIYYADGGATNANNYVAAASTNTYYLACSEYDTLPITVNLKGTAASTSTIQIFGYRQFGGDIYEASPSLSILVTMNGTTYVPTLTNFSVQGASTIKLQIGNTNASAPGLTNLVILTRPKALKRGVFSASHF